MDTLFFLETLNPKTVIPGHFTGNEDFHPESLTFTENYVKDFIQSEKATKNSQSLIKIMEKAYSDIASRNLELSAKVAKGEQEWDEEAIMLEEVLSQILFPERQQKFNLRQAITLNWNTRKTIR